MKLIKIKDNLLAQVFAGLIHKKTLIWTDLKIRPGGGGSDGNNEDIYTSEKIAEAYNRIEESGGVAATRLDFKPMQNEHIGDMSNFKSTEVSELTKYLEATIVSTDEMEQFIKAKFLFSEEKIRDCLSTNTVQKTLREQVEELHNKILGLEEQNKIALDRIADSDKGTSDNVQNIQAQADKLLADKMNL